MARLTLANGRIFDTDTGTMVGGNLTQDDDPATFDPPVGDPATTPDTTTSPTPDQTGFDPFRAGGRSRVTVPENIATWINTASGGDADLAHTIAGVIYQRMRWGKAKNQVTPELAESIAQGLRAERSAQDQPGGAGFVTWANAAARVYGRSDPNYESVMTSFKWTGTTADKTFAEPAAARGRRPRGPTASEIKLASPVTASDVSDLYHQYLGRSVSDDTDGGEGAVAGRVGEGRTYGQVLQEIRGSPEARQFAIKGDKITEVRRWATTMWRSLGLKDPTLDEIMNIVNNNWSQQQAESFLKMQPYGTAKNPDGSDKTIGQAATIRDAVIRAFQKAGLNADEGTINDFIVNNHPITNADAYVSQYIKQHGMVNPADYADARKQLAQTLAGFGVNVNPNDIDPALLAAAVAGHWTADQMTQAVGSRQAPGAPPGTTLDRYRTSKEAMDGIWKTYFPNVTMPKPYQDEMMAMTPDQMAAFVGAMPSLDAQQAGLIVPVKTYTDARAAARQSLSKLGVIGREPSAAEVAYFAAHGLDAEAVQQHYATDPQVLAQNPGAQYGLSHETYGLERTAIEKSRQTDFGGEVNADPTSANEPEWLKTIFKQKITPEAAHSMFGDYFKRQGRAPTAEEIGAYQSRHKETFSGGRTASAVGAGGTMPALAGPAANRR